MAGKINDGQQRQALEDAQADQHREFGEHVGRQLQVHHAFALVDRPLAHDVARRVVAAEPDRRQRSSGIPARQCWRPSHRRPGSTLGSTGLTPLAGSLITLYTIAISTANSGACRRRMISCARSRTFNTRLRRTSMSHCVKTEAPARLRRLIARGRNLARPVFHELLAIARPHITLAPLRCLRRGQTGQQHLRTQILFRWLLHLRGFAFAGLAMEELDGIGIGGTEESQRAGASRDRARS